MRKDKVKILQEELTGLVDAIEPVNTYKW